jgi:hypothetical protein
LRWVADQPLGHLLQLLFDVDGWECDIPTCSVDVVDANPTGFN